MMLLELLVWIAILAFGWLFQDLVFSAASRLVRLLLAVIDGFSAFWMCVISRDYRIMQFSMWTDAADHQRRALLIKAALSCIAGIGLPVLTLILM